MPYKIIKNLNDSTKWDIVELKNEDYKYVEDLSYYQAREWVLSHAGNVSN